MGSVFFQAPNNVLGQPGCADGLLYARQRWWHGHSQVWWVHGHVEAALMGEMKDVRLLGEKPTDSFSAKHAPTFFRGQLSVSGKLGLHHKNDFDHYV